MDPTILGSGANLPHPVHIRLNSLFFLRMELYPLISMLSKDRSESAAEKFFRKILENDHSENPSVIGVDKHDPFPHTFVTMQKGECLPKG